MNAKDHYDKHLGNFYSWMVGNFEEMQAQQENFFRSNMIRPLASGVALDLGAGNGLQSISLAKIGFSVTAIDFSRQLLSELKAQRSVSDFSIQIVESDILSFLKNYKTSADLVVCMGDTLTHLESRSQVETLIESSAKILIPRGKIIFSFRDLTHELENEQRFIPVRNDENKILTCFLEYHSSHVMVYDILHEKKNGTWSQKISVYPKLRLNETDVNEILYRNNIIPIYSQTINRMNYLIGEKN